MVQQTVGIQILDTPDYMLSTRFQSTGIVIWSYYRSQILFNKKFKWPKLLNEQLNSPPVKGIIIYNIYFLMWFTSCINDAISKLDFEIIQQQTGHE